MNLTDLSLVTQVAVLGNRKAFDIIASAAKEFREAR